ncbi:baseplate spike [Vibrio phage 5P1c]
MTIESTRVNRNPLVKAPSSLTGGMISVLEAFMEDKSRDIHTCIPANVISVNYDEGYVTVQPLITTVRDHSYESELPYPVLEEVPIFFNSAGRGKARMSFPIKAGDTGLLLFSERSVENFLNSDGVSLQKSNNYNGVGIGGVANPIGFLPEIFTASSARKFSSSDIVLENEKAVTNHAPDGTITSTSGSATSVINPDGSATVSNGGGFITLQADGSVNINGFIITPNGAATSPVSVTSPSVVAGASLTVKGKEMDGHEHLVGTYKDAENRPIKGVSGEPA